jgi:hypothetical protein
MADNARILPEVETQHISPRIRENNYMLQILNLTNPQNAEGASGQTYEEMT